MVEISRKLLIIGCSKRKRQLQEAPAIEVYDGPYYRMLRKAKLEAVDISILSAKYGLIDYKTKISPYDVVWGVVISDQEVFSIRNFFLR